MPHLSGIDVSTALPPRGRRTALPNLHGVELDQPGAEVSIPGLGEAETVSSDLGEAEMLQLAVQRVEFNLPGVDSRH